MRDITGARLAALRAPRRRCRITVVIPACNEASSIVATLAALTAQRDIDGRPLPHNLFDVIVFANNCSDDTAAAVRGIAAQRPQVDIFVIEDTLRFEDAHIGTARKYVMDLAAARFDAAGITDGIIASIDSDTIPGEHWIGWIAREICGRDAVAGYVTLAAADQERLLAPVRRLYVRELAYRRVLAEVESLIDPLPEDPQPRHGCFVGASFAVTARCYRAAGGLPPLRRLEDLEFAHALRRMDKRIRHSPLVRATTSPRLAARVAGGFGSFIADLHECARRGDSFRVEHPLRTLEDIASRAAVRRIWKGEERRGDVAQTAAIFNLSPQRWLPWIDPEVPLGSVYERIAQRAQSARRRYAPARVEFAIDVLHAAAHTAKSHVIALDDGALRTPTRSSSRL